MNYLARNIRFLRKSRKWSQEELAKRLDVKRSSIAAYESKNVRPRLDFILALSKLFGVPLSDLVERDIEKGDKVKSPENQNQAVSLPKGELTFLRPELHLQDEASIRKFIEGSSRIRKMLDGFKVFYRFKLEHLPQLSEDARRLTADMENFLFLMEHLLAYNEACINALSKKPS